MDLRKKSAANDENFERPKEFAPGGAIGNDDR
jgi:hypothetical protein